eukprot:gene23621-23824_t
MTAAPALMMVAYDRLHAAFDALHAGDTALMEAALPDVELAYSLLPDPQCDDDAATTIKWC